MEKSECLNDEHQSAINESHSHKVLYICRYAHSTRGWLYHHYIIFPRCKKMKNGTPHKRQYRASQRIDPLGIRKDITIKNPIVSIHEGDTDIGRRIITYMKSNGIA